MPCANWSTWVLISLCLIACFVCSEGNIKRIEIKALIPRTSCDIKQLLPFPEEGDTVRCSTNGRGGSHMVTDRSLCQVTRNETVFQYHCVEGFWKLSKGTDANFRTKRFWQALLIGAAIASIATMIYCGVKHGNVLCSEEAVKKEELKPPKYTVCPPRDIKSEYIAKRKETTVRVTWTDPVATDDREVVSNVQTGGNKKGSLFKGLPNKQGGYRHNIIYTAKDGHKLTQTCGFTFVVKYLTCDEPPPPSNGWKVSCKDGYIYGGQCEFKCNDGYEMVGSSIATCQKDQKWDNSPRCKKVKCNKPFNVTNGKVKCDTNYYEFDDDCQISCNDGFKLYGPSKLTCRANRSWSVDRNDVSCVDDGPPVIACKTTQFFYANRGTFNTSVTWITPTATDNVDENPDILQTSGPAQGDILQEGSHPVKYKAIDSTGNSLPAQSECTIVLEVKVIKCSTGPTDALDNSRFMMYNCSDTSFYNGVSCVLDCDLNLPLIGTNNITCERDGITDKGKWIWGGENQPFCEVVECPALDAPDNGAMLTDSINARPLHVMTCKKGYDIPSVGSQFVGRLTCQDSGNWYPLDAFPDCIIPTLPWLNLPVELYYEGDCNDNETKTQIKENVLVYLSGVKADIDRSICPDNDTCKIENLNVVCGDTPVRKRKSVSSHSIYKRSAYGLIRFDILKKWERGNKTVKESFNSISNDLKGIADKIEQDARNNVILNIDGFTLPSDGVQRRSPGLQCDPGYKIDAASLQCKPCPPGFYFDSDTRNCEFCKKGEYMDHEGASQCDLCPDSYSTLAPGAKDISKCLKLCTPGFFSTTTMEPCSACPVGSYQSQEGQSSCISCPAGKATSKTGSTSAHDCDFFDILIQDLAQRTLIGSFTANKTQLLTFSVWLKFQTEMNEDVAMHIADSYGDIVTLRIASEISVQVGSGNVSLTDARLSASRWTQIVCEIDIYTGSLRLYVSGSLKVDETGITIVPSRLFSDGKIELLTNSDGLYVSGFVLYDRILSEDDVTKLSQTCAVTYSYEIFTMTGILSHVEEGINIVTPTSCDPIDECAARPCGRHTCINLVNDFSCICHGGMTGDLCDILPNYCINNRCVQGDCLSGNGTYSCTCNNGFSGVFCDIPPVNGGWSQWSEWSGCDVTCGGGFTLRSRNCNNPLPSPFGNKCEGENAESLTCNDKECPTCPQLKRSFGTVVTCKNITVTLQKCNITCLPDLALANGQTNFLEYTCGESTGYEWLPVNKLPECVELKRPEILGIRTVVEYTQPITGSAQTDVTAAVENNLSEVGCNSHIACSLSTTISNGNKSRKRRDSSSTLAVQFSIKLSETGGLDIAGYLANGTETAAMTELLGALRSLNEGIEYVQNNTESIFQVTVDGVEYSLESTSLDLAATVACPSGYAGADGLCAKCPVGTYLVDFQCINCEVGTYQPLVAQSECLACPSGYTTATFGASDISECYMEKTEFHDDVVDDDDDVNYDDVRAIIIVVSVVCGVVLVGSIIVGGFCLWKYVIRRRLYSVARPTSSGSNAGNSVQTKFNEMEDLPAGSDNSVEIPLVKCALNDAQQPYGSQDI